ncbi:MAG: penicillin-binding protein 1C, partial [Bacteroidetes bacterium]|nr:penicillin-binding protein 1C [Fibrella sp.]
QRCQHQKIVFTDSAKTVSYCAHCLPAGQFVSSAYPNLAPEVIAHYNARRLPYESLPPHNPACERVFAASGTQHELTITSPNDGSTYFLDVKNSTQMQLSCQATNEVRTVFWYLNDRLYRKARPTEAVFFTPRPGRLKISCADDKGRHVDSAVLIRPE